jgi:hypothetical protein
MFATPTKSKSFLVLFFKKELLPYLPWRRNKLLAVTGDQTEPSRTPILFRLLDARRIGTDEIPPEVAWAIWSESSSVTSRGEHGPPGRGWARRSESSSFLKKRTKKLLSGCRGLVGDSRTRVFASFFKKKCFLAKAPRSATPSAHASR